MEKLYSFRNAMMIVAILLVFPIFASKAAAQEAGNTASTFKFNNVSPSIPAGTTTYTQTISGATGVTYSIGTCVLTDAEGNAVNTQPSVNSTTGALSISNGCYGAIQVIAKAGNQQTDYVLTVAYPAHKWNFCKQTLTPTPNGRLGNSPQAIGDPGDSHGSVTKTADVNYWDIEAKAPWSDSPLQPNVEEKQMGASDANTKYYVYTNRFFTTSNPEYQTGKQYLFYQINSAGTLAANKAYLKLNTSSSNGAKQNILLRLMDGETTGISYTPATDKVNKQDCFTLSGLKLNGTPTPGQIYIQGGKKYIAK